MYQDSSKSFFEDPQSIPISIPILASRRSTLPLLYFLSLQLIPTNQSQNGLLSLFVHFRQLMLFCLRKRFRELCQSKTTTHPHFGPDTFDPRCPVLRERNGSTKLVSPQICSAFMLKTIRGSEPSTSIH